LSAAANGTYRVIACANDTKTVTEKTRRNNCRASAPFVVHPAQHPDTTPPTFAGVKTASGGCGVTSCSHPAHLTWDEGSDNFTSQSAIVYDIYRGSYDSPGSENFSAPTYTSSPGATSFTAPAADPPFGCWVVRARDQAGNREKNTHEVCNAPDATAPSFAGVKTASGGCGYVGCSNPAHLTWDAATDNVTSQSAIVYDIYRTSFDRPGTENYSAPTYTSPPGATDFTAPAADSPVGCWVVRARDQTGNRDANTHEVCNSPPP
jgi:hypothetical protein